MWALGKDYNHTCVFLHYLYYSVGDKIASTIIAQSAEVPTLPWSGSGKYDR